MNSLSPNSVPLKLSRWYKNNRRRLPWRETRDPYAIWLSEVILQQTRVEQGMAYYKRYLSEYPEIGLLADAPEDEVMKHWQGLGYYSRARNLHKAAKKVVESFSGSFPTDFEDIKSLPGIGDYTASAIASIAYNKPYAVVDGNVYRVLARLYGLNTPIDSPSGRKQFAAVARDLLNEKDPGTHNQAIMELGALVCKPQNPACEICPVQHDCMAFANGNVSAFPVKEKKVKIRERYFNYIVIHNNEEIVLKKRGPGDIWQNLYDFPMVEDEKLLDVESMLLNKDWKSFYNGKNPLVETVADAGIHKLTHQYIHIRFFIFRLSDLSNLNLKDFIRVSKKTLSEFPVPKPVEKFLPWLD